MTRQKIQIKKIDNPTARQVTFSKRRRGLFKKAQELSTLCDVEVAAIVFSATGKLFEYSSSSMKQVIERHNMHPQNHSKLDQPSLELRLESSTYAKLSKELAEKTHELRQMKGEDLQGLNIKELEQLEKSLQEGLNRVQQTKGERIQKEVDTLWIKGEKLMEENQRLKQKQQGENNAHHLQRHSFESVVTNFSSSADNNSQDKDSSDDTSLKLGLPFPN